MSPKKYNLTARQKRATAAVAAMADVKQVVKKHGRLAVGNCLAKIKNHEKEMARLETLKKEVAKLEKQL